MHKKLNKDKGLRNFFEIRDIFELIRQIFGTLVSKEKSYVAE